MKLAQVLQQRDFQAAIFDMDGILVDSEELTLQLADGLLKEHGANRTVAELNTGYGEPDIYLFQRAVETYALDIDPQELLVEHYRRENERLAELKLLPGVEQILETPYKILLFVLCSRSKCYKVNFVQDQSI